MISFYKITFADVVLIIFLIVTAFHGWRFFVITNKKSVSGVWYVKRIFKENGKKYFELENIGWGTRATVDVGEYFVDDDIKVGFDVVVRGKTIRPKKSFFSF
ncbi:hypothetical protein KKG48_02885 [Patescibacteria group bacterium]|nr:hypothetical protein [Patescibacteria group bacterium]